MGWVVFSLVIVSPAGFKAVAEVDGDCVHPQQENQQHDDGGTGLFDKGRVDLVRPEVNLHRQCGRGIGEFLTVAKR